MITAFSGTRMLRNTTISRRKLSSSTTPISHRHALAEEVGEVGRCGGGATDLGVDACRRDDVVAQRVHERRRLGVLRRALRVDG